MTTSVAARAPVDASRRIELPRGIASVGILAGYAGIVLLLFRQTWGDPAHRVIGGHGDAEESIWYLTWAPWALLHGQNPLVTHQMGLPGGVNLMWNTPQTLTALLAWPVTAAAGPVVAYNVMMTLAPVVSGWCAYLVIRRHVPGHLPAALGGLLYGLSPYVLAHAVGHLNLTTVWVPPLLLLVLEEVLVRQRRSWLVGGAALGVLATCQLFIAEELLASEALVAAVAAAVLAVLFRAEVGPRLGHALRSLAVAGAVALVLGGWAIGIQFLGAQRVQGGVQPPGIYVTDLLNLGVPTNVEGLAPSWALSVSSAFTGNGAEQNGYLGIPLIAVLAMITVRRWDRPLVRVTALTGLAAVVLSLGPSLHVGGRLTHIPLPGALIGHVPVLDNLLPARLMLYAFLLAAVLLAVFVDEMRRRRATAVAGGMVVAAIAVTLFPRLPFPSSAVSTPAFFTGAGVRQIPQDEVALVAPWVSSPVPDDPMLWQALSGMRFRMPEGYYQGPDRSGHRIYGPVPSTTSAVMEAIWARGEVRPLTAELRLRIAADLDAWSVRDILVGPMPHREEMTAFMTTLTGRAPVETGGVALWSHVDPRLLAAPPRSGRGSRSSPTPSSPGTAPAPR
jgi:hypothetical protein